MNERIRQIRKNLEMNQTEFGEMLGCSQTAVAKYESGLVVPDKPLRLLICEKFNVNLTWLETGEGDPYKQGITYDVLRALDAMPALKEAFAAVLPKLTLQDMKTINALLEKFQHDQE